MSLSDTYRRGGLVLAQLCSGFADGGAVVGRTAGKCWATFMLWGGGAGDDGAMADSIRTQIVNIYAVHNPEKLGLIDELLAEWRGDEELLLANIKEKYLPAEEQGDATSDTSSARSSGGSPGSLGETRRPTIGRPSSAGAGPRAQEDMDYLRAQLKQAKAQAEAAEAAKVAQQAAHTAGAAVSIQAAWRGKSSRLERQRAVRAPAAGTLGQPVSSLDGPDTQRVPPDTGSHGTDERQRYVVSIPLSMDGLGIGLQNGPDGCPYVAHLDAGGEAETAGVILNSAILAVSGVVVSGASGGMDVRDVKGLMAQALRTGQPVQLELRAPAGAQPQTDGRAAARASVLDEPSDSDAVVDEEKEATVDEESVDTAHELYVDENVSAESVDRDSDVEPEDEGDEDTYEESFEDIVDSEAEPEADGPQGAQPRTSGATTPPSDHLYSDPDGNSVDAHISLQRGAPRGAVAEQRLQAEEAEKVAALAAVQRAEIEQLRRANQTAEEQRLEVARLSSTLQEVMQRLTASESTSEEGRVESELAALRQSVAMLVSDKQDAEITATPLPGSHNAPLWGPQMTDFEDHAAPARARSSERARSAEREQERLRARSAERDRMREQLHPKNAPAKKKWTYKKKHGYNPEVWNRLYGAKKPPPPPPAYDSMAWGKPEHRDESQKENSTNGGSSKAHSAGSYDPLSVYGSRNDQRAWATGSTSESSNGQSRSFRSSSSTAPYNDKPAQRRRSVDRSRDDRIRRASSVERQGSHRRPGSTERHERRRSDPAVQFFAHGVSRTYPQPSTAPGPLWLSGLIDNETSPGDERQRLQQQRSLPAPLSPQSTVDFQPSLEAAVSGAARHSDDYTAFLEQHPVPGARATRRPLTSLAGGKADATERRRERERSYSDYGVYESPMSQTSAEDTQESGCRPEETGEEEGCGALEQQQRKLIGILRREHLSKREELGDQHPETVETLTKFVEHTTGMATMFLETGRGAEAWELLSDVHTAAKHQPMLLPGVQNSMACCLRRAGRLRAAESMLQKAAAAVKGKGYSASARGNTYLNLCAVLSSQGKHQAALDAAKQVGAAPSCDGLLLFPVCCVSPS